MKIEITQEQIDELSSVLSEISLCPGNINLGENCEGNNCKECWKSAFGSMQCKEKKKLMKSKTI